MAPIKWKPFQDGKDYAYDRRGAEEGVAGAASRRLRALPRRRFRQERSRRASAAQGRAGRRACRGGPAIGLAGLSSRRLWRGGRGRDGARADRRQCRQQGRQHLRDLSRDGRRAQARDPSAIGRTRRGAAGAPRPIFPTPFIFMPRRSAAIPRKSPSPRRSRRGWAARSRRASTRRSLGPRPCGGPYRAGRL